MEYKNIDQLLEKYWEGESSLADEKLLKAYFREGKIEAGHRQYAPLFDYIKSESSNALSADFDQQLIARLDGVKPNSNQPKRLFLWLSRAAVVLVLIAVALYLQKVPLNDAKDHTSYIQGKEMTPEEAWEQTKAALELVSRKLNKGSEEASKGLSKVNAATKIIKN